MTDLRLAWLLVPICITVSVLVLTARLLALSSSIRRRRRAIARGLLKVLDPEELLGRGYEDRYCSRCGRHAKVWRGNDPQERCPWTCGACGALNYIPRMAKE